MKKALKIIAIVLVVLYVGVVVLFETMLGRTQPQMAGRTVVITTVDQEGKAFDRVVSRIDSGGHLYVAANHWPRAWYHRALDNPQVEVTIEGVKRPYLAVPAEDEEAERVNDENRRGLGFLLVTGFPPRYFLRLDPVPVPQAQPGEQPAEAASEDVAPADEAGAATGGAPAGETAAAGGDDTPPG